MGGGGGGGLFGINNKNCIGYNNAASGSCTNFAENVPNGIHEIPNLTLSRPREMSNFSKSLAMNWETTCDIPSKRYFLGCAINHTNRDGRGHILE